MNAPVIHIGGWPGCGKRTIALRLRDMIGARLIDNHLILNPASALFDRGTPERAALRERLRAVIYEAALTLPRDVPLILTDALATSDADGPLVVPMLDFVNVRGAPFVPVVLSITERENLRRLADPRREGTGKLMDQVILTELRARHEILRLPGATEIEVSDVTAEAAAATIAALIPQGGAHRD